MNDPNLHQYDSLQVKSGVDPVRLLMVPNDDTMGRLIGPSGATMRDIQVQCRVLYGEVNY